MSDTQPPLAPPPWPDRRVVVVIWAAFVVLHLILFALDLYPASRRPLGDEVMYRDLAERAARGEPVDIDLLWPPLYVWLLTPFATLGAAWPHVVALVQVALLAGSAVLFQSLTSRVTGSAPAARLAQAFLLLDPQMAGFAHYLWPEILHVFLLVLLLWLLVARPGHHAWWLGAGIATGALCLTKSVVQPFLPVVALAMIWELGWRRGSLRAFGILAVAGAIVLPTMVENRRSHGAFVIADGSSFNLWVGLNAQGRRASVNDIAGREFQLYQASAPTFAERRRVLWRKIDALVAERGVVTLLRAQLSKQYFRLLDYRSFLTEQLAGGSYAAQGVGYVEAGESVSTLLRVWSVIIYGLVLGAAGLGLLATPLHNRAWLVTLFAFLAYGLLIFLGLEARSRFRIPLMLPLYVAAGLALARAIGRGTNRHSAFEVRHTTGALAETAVIVSAWRVWAGALASLALLVLAFGDAFLR